MDDLFKVVNVVATASLDRPINLELLHKRFPRSVRYSQNLYGGRVAYLKVESMEGKVSIFRSGKLISIGTKSIEKAIEELKLVAMTLGAKLDTQPKVQSIVAIADLGKSINLERIVNEIQEERGLYVMYEPEQFPGAIIKFPVNESKLATILLFSSGKVVCIGLTCYNHIRKALKFLTIKLLELQAAKLHD